MWIIDERSRRGHLIKYKQRVNQIDEVGKSAQNSEASPREEHIHETCEATNRKTQMKINETKQENEANLKELISMEIILMSWI